MLEIDTSDIKEQRKFGIVMAVAISAVTLIHGFIRGHFALWPFYLAAAFLALGLVLPRALQPIFFIWMKFAEAVNWVMTRLLLSIVFFGMITPMLYLIRIFSDDPLKRAFLKDADTYWEEPDEQPDDPERYKNMF